MNLNVRDAEPEDVPLVMSFIRELAEYEKLADEVDGTETELAEHLFGEPTRVSALIADVIDENGTASPAGFALTFTNYSTFITRPGVYLEDLFVRPEFRKQGIGVALLRAVASRAVAMGARRVEWCVLDWNESAIEFYEALGARPNDGWKIYRLTGEALEKLAT